VFSKLLRDGSEVRRDVTRSRRGQVQQKTSPWLTSMKRGMQNATFGPDARWSAKWLPA